MKKLFVGAVVFYSMGITAQESTMYVAAKAGLSIREKPDVNAKVLDKIPYATKIELKESGEERKKINTEGLTGYWKKDKYIGEYEKQYVVIACGGGKIGSKSGDEYVAFALPD